MTEKNKNAGLEIERASFSIIEQELKAMGKTLPEAYASIIKRVIHTTADFSYVDTLYFSPQALETAEEALKRGALIVTDTNMARAGINQKALALLGGEVCCFMAEKDVAEEAKARNMTRAAVSAERALRLGREWIYVVGNAPTAILQLLAMLKGHGERGLAPPSLVIGVPVGFVNVVEAKEQLIASHLPCIVNRGRKGGSNVAAGIVNAVLYRSKHPLE